MNLRMYACIHVGVRVCVYVFVQHRVVMPFMLVAVQPQIRDSQDAIVNILRGHPQNGGTSRGGLGADWGR